MGGQMIENSDGKASSSKGIKGEIWVNEFTEKSALKFREQVAELAGFDKNRPIIVRIDSYGGYVDALSNMLETMDSVPNPFITSCEGKAMSCGALLLSNGDYRFCGKHSRVMIHEFSAGAFGDVHDIHNSTSETKRMNQYFMGILAKNCGIRNGYRGIRKIIKEHDGRDLYLTADEALDFGIIDEIGIPNVRPIIFYQIYADGYHSYLIDGGKGKKKTSSKRKR
jgi:ATP-dependent Clp protease, protease subunit